MLSLTTYKQTHLFPEYEANDPSINMGSEEWRRRATEAIGEVARLKLYFTTDDIWRRMNVRCQDPRKLGPIIFRAWVQGVIRRTDITTNSLRPVCHGRPVRVWQSMLYEDPVDTHPVIRTKGEHRDQTTFEETE